MNIKSAEVNRKLVHLLSLVIPFIYYFTNKSIAVAFVSITFIILTSWDVLRLNNNNKIFSVINNIFLRKSEVKRLSGSFFFISACLIGVIFFGKYVFILSVCILIISDTFAALVGINYGKHKIYNKSLEGGLAFFITGLLVIILVNLLFNKPVLSISCLIALIVSTVAELYSYKLKINDNFLILVVFGCTYYFVNFFIM